LRAVLPQTATDNAAYRFQTLARDPGAKTGRFAIVDDI